MESCARLVKNDNLQPLPTSLENHLGTEQGGDGRLPLGTVEIAALIS